VTLRQKCLSVTFLELQMKRSSSAENRYRILCVCLGNICRSPAAHAILESMIEEQGLSEQCEVDSAGTGGWHAGELPDPRMRAHGTSRGYELTHRARQFKSSDFHEFDLILTMDDSNYRNVMALRPDGDCRGEVRKMVSFSLELEPDEVPDPYYGGDAEFSETYDIIEDACRGVLKKLTSELLTRR